MRSATFCKSERITSQKLIDELFSSGKTHSMMAFPLRAVYMTRQRVEGEEPVQLLISVPKKRLHHAVDRNRTKRQIREAFRLNKYRVTEQLPADQQLVIALIWINDSLQSTDTVASRTKTILKRIAESL